MIRPSILLRAAPVLGLLLAISLTLPGMNADAGPPPAVFVKLDPAKPDPMIEAEAIAAEDGEWLLRMEIDGFAFSDICQVVRSGEPVGHAHVYAGDKKIASAYQPILSLGKLSPGRYVFDIVLRAQDHRALVGSQGLIKSVVEVTVG